MRDFYTMPVGTRVVATRDLDAGGLKIPNGTEGFIDKDQTCGGIRTSCDIFWTSLNCTSIHLASEDGVCSQYDMNPVRYGVPEIKIDDRSQAVADHSDQTFLPL